MVSTTSLIVLCIMFFGYIITSTLLQYLYYYRNHHKLKMWKIQSSVECSSYNRMFTWWLPFLNLKQNRAPDHWILATINLIVASCFAGATCELCINNQSKMIFDTLESYGYLTAFYDFCIAIIYENTVEYYWHRIMHSKLCYKRFHKFHHFYKNPEPFDDMYIHPLEAFGYYCILYAPPFLFRCHISAFLGYMVVMGVCGILDHSGIKFEVPFLYNTVDHDNHHLKFDVNYGFPSPLMDIFHGTYDGLFMGIKFKCK